MFPCGCWLLLLVHSIFSDSDMIIYRQHTKYLNLIELGYHPALRGLLSYRSVRITGILGAWKHQPIGILLDLSPLFCAESGVQVRRTQRTGCRQGWSVTVSVQTSGKPHTPHSWELCKDWDRAGEQNLQSLDINPRMTEGHSCQLQAYNEQRTGLEM